jgi:hypothetical protein
VRFDVRPPGSTDPVTNAYWHGLDPEP